MDDYIDRLMMCGWRRDQAYRIVDNFLKNLDLDGLADFVRLEECGLCM